MKTLESAKVRDQKLSITYLCQLLEVSRKGYYKHTFTEQDEDVKVASVLHYCQYVRSKLPKAGVDTLQQCANEYFKGTFQVGRDWLYKVLGANDMLLRSRKRKRPPQTTKGVVNHGFQDHLNTTPKYIATDHCRLTVSDITYVKYLGGFAYLSLTMDAYSRIITGFDLQPKLTTDGPYNALRQTVDFYQSHGFDLEGLIFHSDRGCQYVSKRMTDYEASLGIVTSVTQTGNPLHNAMAERLNGTIKNDWLYDFENMPLDEVRESLSQTIALYNTARPHRALNKKTPMQMLIPNYPNPLTTQPSKKQTSKNDSPKASSLKTPSVCRLTSNKELSLCTSSVNTTTSRVPQQEQN